MASHCRPSEQSRGKLSQVSGVPNHAQSCPLLRECTNVAADAQVCLTNATNTSIFAHDETASNTVGFGCRQSKRIVADKCDPYPHHVFGGLHRHCFAPQPGYSN